MMSQQIGDLRLNMSDYERMSKPLKPCPFCGREALMKVYNRVPTGYAYTPTCTDKSCAGRLTKRWKDINLAVNAWNTRAYEPHETVTEFADRCRECGARYGRLLKAEIRKHCEHYMDGDIIADDVIQAVENIGSAESEENNG